MENVREERLVSYRIYADRVWIMHTCINVLLLFLTAKLSGITVRVRRIIEIAAGNALCFTAILLLPAPAVLQEEVGIILAGKTFFCLIAALWWVQRCFQVKSREGMRRVWICYMCCACVLGGVCNGISEVRELFETDQNGFGTGGQVSMMQLLVWCAIVVWYGAKLLDRERRRQKHPIWKVSFFWKTKFFSGSALMDSGNSLKDPYTGRPVCILDEETAKKLQSAAANYQAKSIVVPAEKTAQEETAGENASESADRAVMEIKYLYSQNQSIYESLSSALNELKESAGAFNEEFAAKIEETLDALDEKIENLLANETDYDKVAETVKERVAETLNFEEPDYDKIAELVAEKTEAQTAAHSKEILDTIAAVPTAENVDYNRIVDEVSDKALEKVTELLEEKSNEEKETKGSAEYDRIVYGTAEKVIESLPPVERVDYTRIAEANALTDETLEKIAASETGVAVANVYSVQRSLLKRKKIEDMLGDNVNHPSDYMARIYTQVILDTLFGEKTGE